MAMRRNSALLAGALCVVCAPGFAQETLTVAVYGGEWGDAIQACILDPFAKQSGVKVMPEPGVSTVTLGKLRQQKGSPVIDVAWIDGGVSELTVPDDLVAAIDPGKVPNVANMIPEAVYKTPTGAIYALSTGFYALGLVYNTKEVKTPPTSWWDLWDKKYADVVTVPSPANAMGVPFIVHIAQLLGGGVDNVEPALKKLRDLKVASFFDSSGGATNNFQAGEVTIGAHYVSAAWALADKGLPITAIVPKEGVPAGDIRVHIVKGTPRQAAAEKLVDYAVSKDASSCMSEKIYVGPPTKGVVPSEKAKARLPWGPEGSVKNLALFDWQKLNAQRQAITEAFNREVAKK
jgi:putative spermidine/putrescine transport system substrate-binding protein